MNLRNQRIPSQKIGFNQEEFKEELKEEFKEDSKEDQKVLEEKLDIDNEISDLKLNRLSEDK